MVGPLSRPRGHPLADFRLKLNRATLHLETLKREIDAWFESHPYGITGKYDAGPPEKYILYFRFFERPPQDWGLLIGEFAHNAARRSTISHGNLSRRTWVYLGGARSFRLCSIHGIGLVQTVSSAFVERPTVTKRLWNSSSPTVAPMRTGSTTT
jgi:hypothetical protein